LEIRQRLAIGPEIADFVDRLCLAHGTERVAAVVDKARSTVRDYVSHPEHLPLVILPELMTLADPDEPFLARLAFALGFRLIPLEPSPEHVAGLLVEAGAITEKKRNAVASILRGMRRDSRQPRLWGEP
jgi:hypothetical protein